MYTEKYENRGVVVLGKYLPIIIRGNFKTL